MENYVGKRLDGRYEIQELIGVGGMAVVYKAYDNIDDRIVAVKILKEEFLQNEEFRRRFKNESKAIAVLSHPNIVKVYDVSFGDRLQYIVMEYVEGITLKEYIEQQKVINWKEALHFVTQILRALQHAHDKGIVHRDIKPQNIMLLQNGNIKVTDFGIARFSRSETRTMTESAIGSVHYISPEQARGEITDDKADIYSVGVVLYEMLTGQLPFQSDSAVSVAIMQLQSDPKSPRELNDQIPIGLEQITMKAMQKDVRDRYQSAAEMLLDLDEFKRNPDIKFDYACFVDNEPTKYIEDTGKLRPAVPPVAEDSFDQEEPARKKAVPILIGIVAGLAVVGIIIGILFGTGVLGGSRVDIPKLVGLNYYNDIEPNLDTTYADYDIVISEETISDSTQAPNTVAEQSPAYEEGKTMRKNGKIVIKLVRSGEDIEIPSVRGSTFEEAKQTLIARGFNVSSDPIAAYDSDLEEGQVIQTIPNGGTKAAAGTTVYIQVNTGEDTNSVEMPDLEVGKNTLEVARMILESVGLELDTSNIQYEDSEYPKDTVIDQDFRAGTSVPKNTKVGVVLSNGSGEPKEYTIRLDNMPNVRNMEATLRVYLDGTENVYNNTVLLNGSPVDMAITGSGTNRKLTVTLNGDTIYECTFDFTAGTKTNESYNYNNFKVSVPNVLGMTQAAAEEELKAYGFQVQVETNTSLNTPSGEVFMQRPVEGRTASYGSTVTITVSSGGMIGGGTSSSETTPAE
ncbi:MAG TPA: Stk1 family PASTA domain-containing Ser/Thr kinase [Candidatus Fimivicinus intestinavium]|nr:Stk1 family PASTA domain-containing Ser/Thr kinase [Candidatus Fimivicinus intestinavium]